MTAASDVLVVVPALDEAATIAEVVDGARRHGYDVVVVDDGSSDETAALASRAGATVLRHERNLGVGGALQTAFRYAQRDGRRAVIQCDADGQHAVEHLDDLVHAWRESGADVVLGSRFRNPAHARRIPRPRRLAMAVLSLIAGRTCRTRVTDVTSGFRLVAEPVLGHFARRFPAHYLGDTFEAVVAVGRGRYRLKEIGVPIRPRKVGQSTATTLRAVLLIARSLLVVLLGINYRIPRAGGQTESRTAHPASSRIPRTKEQP